MYHFFPAIKIERQSTAPVYHQIVEQFIEHILSGRLKQGQRLPGARVIASELKVHRKTLQIALNELAAQGWLIIYPRSGAFVARELPKNDIVKGRTSVPTSFPSKPNFDLTISNAFLPSADFQYTRKLLLAEGLPDIRIAPIRQIMQELRSIEKRGNLRRYFQYGNPQGIPYLRETLSTHLSETRDIHAQPEQVMITRGTQMGISLAGSVLLKPGDHVVVGNPGYFTAAQTFERSGAKIIRIPVDDHGMDINKLEQLCDQTKIRLVYVIPHHHYPTTVTLTLERREKLLSLACKHKFVILEDDFDYDFHYDGGPIAPLSSLDNHGNVIYLGTLTKTLMPALRIGFMVAPEAFIREACKIRRLIDFQGDSVMEAAVAELYRNGVISGHIKKAVRIYRERRNTFCELLQQRLKDRISFRKPEGGLNIWVKFYNTNLTQLTQKVAEKGLIVNDGSIYDTDHSKNFLRLGFSALNLAEQEEAVKILADHV